MYISKRREKKRHREIAEEREKLMEKRAKEVNNG